MTARIINKVIGSHFDGLTVVLTRDTELDFIFVNTHKRFLLRTLL